MSEFEQQIVEILERAKADSLLVAYHREDQEPGYFCCGFFREVEDGFAIFDDVGKFGYSDNEDAEAEAEISAISWVEVDTPYLHGMQTIYNHRDRFVAPMESPVLDEPMSIWHAVAEACREQRCCKFWLGGEDQEFGFVRRFEAPLVELEMVHEDDGSIAGRRTIRMELIDSLRMGSRHEEMVQFLYESRYKFLDA